MRAGGSLPTPRGSAKGPVTVSVRFMHLMGRPGECQRHRWEACLLAFVHAGTTRHDRRPCHAQRARDPAKHAATAGSCR